MGRKAKGSAYEKPAGSGQYWYAFLLRSKRRWVKRVPERPDGRPVTAADAEAYKNEALRRYLAREWDPEAPAPAAAAPEPTLAEYALTWARDLTHSSADNERRCVELYVAPMSIGALRLSEVRPHHVAAWVAELRLRPSTKGGLLAPLTVRSFVGVLRRLYTQACFEELTAVNPCVLPRGKLPEARDKVAGARATWRFQREEIETLISDVATPLVRRVIYALLFLTGMRASEMIVLRWRDYDPTLLPLGGLAVARAMKLVRPVRTEKRRKVIGGTKTEVAKAVPVHATLAAMLAEWKLGGWARLAGRVPGPDDLVVPTTKLTVRDRDATYTR